MLTPTPFSGQQGSLGVIMFKIEHRRLQHQFFVSNGEEEAKRSWKSSSHLLENLEGGCREEEGRRTNFV
jgi:hypothetical protein